MLQYMIRKGLILGVGAFFLICGLLTACQDFYDTDETGQSESVPEVPEEEFPPRPPEIISFEADPDVVDFGETTILSWEIRGADIAVILPDVGVVDRKAGEVEVRIFTTTLYELTATNADGADYAQVTVRTCGTMVFGDEDLSLSNLCMNILVLFVPIGVIILWRRIIKRPAK